jgi:tetratricopeptide (TPR) repeat protein
MSRKNNSGLALLISSAVLVITPSLRTRPLSNEREAVIKIVTEIQKADYEGDRLDLQRHYSELTPFIEHKEFLSRVFYWRGFALWRRAINGFNDNVDKADLERDLQQAAEEFDKSASADPDFVDSKIALGSCYGLLAYSVAKKEAPEQQALAAKSRQALKDAQTAAPDNPRLLWVLGPVYWNIPVERGGGQAKALEAYQKGLETIRSHKDRKADPLDPSWGQPELLMSLAWSDLNRATPDLKAAEQNASSALQIVPYWHYVRDILLPQIREAQRQQVAPG